MPKILIHIHSGLDQKNKATLGMVLAVHALKKGCEVTLFSAANGFHLMNCDQKNMVVGQGTGDLKDHLDELKAANVQFFVSGMSAKARGYDDTILEGYNVSFAMPDVLLDCSFKADTVLYY